MEQAVLVFRSIGCGQAGYYLDGPGRGRWLGTGCTTLGLDGTVGEDDFRGALAGRGADGSALLARIPKNRRAGFDLVFAAPKSVSLLAALAPAADAVKVAEAHDAAVADAVEYLERCALRTRRGDNGGMVAAAFGHHTSGAGDPHLHTHVVVANLVLGRDERWGCLDRLSLWQHAGAAGALYQASLRHHLAGCGFRLGSRVRADGLADVEGVPRSAIDACSSRRRQLLADAAAAGLTSARGRAAAAGRTRRTPRPAASDRDWEARAAAAGLGRAIVAELLSAASSASSPAGAERSSSDLEERLTANASTFTRADVVAAIAATAPPEAGTAAIEQEADRFVGTAVPVDGRHWTTARVQRLDRAMVAMVNGRWRSAGLVPPEIAEAAVGDRPSLDRDQQAAVRRLTTGGSGVDVLAGSLVHQAGVVDAARAAWEGAGHRVAMVTASERAEARWRALTTVGPPPPPPSRASVVIVDAADRMPTVTLHRLVDDTAARGAKLVLVAGGTSLPRREPASAGLAALAERVGSIHLSPDVVDRGPAADTVRAGRDGTIVLSPTPADAASRIVADWHASRAGPKPATMVALGPDEAEYLNRLARATRHTAGELTGPVLTAGDREFQAGDEVRVLRRDRRLSAPVGSTGRVTAVDPSRREATVCWSGRGERTEVVAAAALAGRSVTHGYATTPGYFREGRTHSLGPILALGPCAGRDVTTYTVAPASVRRREQDPLGDLVATLKPATPAIPRPVGHSLADLERQRGRLAAQLLGSAPPDVSASLRRVDEERVWLGRPAAAELDRRRESLERAQRHRAAWLERHRDDLERWAAVDDAIAWRVEALGRGAELAPTRAVADRLGPPPADERDRQAWRQVAGAIEAYRDRWALPDEPLALRSAPDPTWDPARLIDQLRVMNACRTADRRLDPGLGVDDNLAISTR